VAVRVRAPIRWYHKRMSTSGTSVSDDLVPMEGSEPVGFDVVRFGGYDRRQVDDYLDRIDEHINGLDARHAHDTARITALQGELEELRERLDDAEGRASGQPEPASRLTARLAEMLRLAEEEAAAIRAAASGEAERTMTSAHQQAAQANRDVTAALELREREVLKRAEQAEAATLQAQRDAEAVRSQGKRDADNLLVAARREADATRSAAEREAAEAVAQARQDVQLLHEHGQKDAANITADARRKVEELARQRDAITAQLQQLRDAVSAMVSPMSIDVTDAQGAPATVRQGPAQGSTRVRPGD
jgi:DivIVA domain-containing protein